MDQPAFNGLFRHIGAAGVQWLRLHQDGQAVLATVAPADARLVACWLRAGPALPAYLPSGTWTVHDRLRLSLRWRVQGKEQRSEYEGEVDAGGAALELTMTEPQPLEPRRFQLIALPDDVLLTAHRVDEYRTIRSFTKLLQAGLTPQDLAALKKTRGLTLATVNVLELDELVQLGVDPQIANRIIAYRSTSRSLPNTI